MIGTRVAHHEITGHLETGGMGEVYQATDATLGRSRFSNPNRTTTNFLRTHLLAYANFFADACVEIRSCVCATSAMRVLKSWKQTMRPNPRLSFLVAEQSITRICCDNQSAAVRGVARRATIYDEGDCNYAIHGASLTHHELDTCIEVTQYQHDYRKMAIDNFDLEDF